jgi:hypothetical protein
MVDTQKLQHAVERQYKVKATLIDSTPLDEIWKGVSWKGIVHTFELQGHPAAERAYAWSQGSRIYTLLHIPPVDSPVKAIRTAIEEQIP